ncbi:FAD-dependent oxidoreductase [Streptomyces iconiensis]|uniref:FAD-dependent oxidoreductase n=1 Tax=Streptomyces iconiensis TaxID=1384038 RepID=A0ABT7A612_9ACTN|nr:FAD-dependent oxidoreductase [Streptomyces iconiensis]MDJ1136512.1 FAD-dependent oxidoreductase [Streptomyces iconiensis]
MSRALDVVVVGYGMVGNRLIEEVGRRDPHGERVRLTVLGAEPSGAYNRVLLPGLLAGSLTEDDLALGGPAGGGHGAGHGHGAGTRALTARTGARAVRIDRAARFVTADDGAQLPYDRLVLATGATAVVPPVPGVRDADGALARGVGVLRTVVDARRVRRLADRARARGERMVVLGGGVLGLEAARALAARGVRVTVVHPAAHVMDRQLDAGAGRVLARSLRRTGVEPRAGATAARWVPGEGLHLEGGEVLRAAGLLLCTGARPDTALAEACGLAVAAEGIAVDDALTTSDPAVHALGDCADADPGLVQPGWEQAAVLAARLTGDDPYARYTGTPRVTRLKAAGIELACLGDPFTEDESGAGADVVADGPGGVGDGPGGTGGGAGGVEDRAGGVGEGAGRAGAGDEGYGAGGTGAEVLRFEDPARERYAKLVLRGDRVTGAILLGLPDAAAGLIQLHDRGAPAPSDRLALMLGRALPPESPTGPEALPDHALVCRCNSVTKGALRTAWYEGARSAPELASATRATTGCGGCAPAVEKLAAWLAETDPVPPTTRGAQAPDVSRGPSPDVNRGLSRDPSRGLSRGLSRDPSRDPSRGLGPDVSPDLNPDPSQDPSPTSTSTATR